MNAYKMRNRKPALFYANKLSLCKRIFVARSFGFSQAIYKWKKVILSVIIFVVVLLLQTLSRKA
jgi:hypothetical protein